MLQTAADWNSLRWKILWIRAMEWYC